MNIRKQYIPSLTVNAFKAMQSCFLLTCSLFLLTSVLSSSLLLNAQNSIEDLTLDDLVYKKERTFSFQLHTSGWGLSGEFVKIHNIKKRSFYQIEVLTMRHPKEFRQQSIFASGRSTARGYVFGKQNSFYNINFMFGRGRMLAEKGRKNGVAISMRYGAGPSLGITKPYYLELIYQIVGGYADTKHEGYNTENAHLFLDERYIFGASGIAFGWNELSFHPGIQGKFAVNFDWASYNEFVKALEVGVMMSAHFSGVESSNDGTTNLRAVPIMISEDNKFIFANLFAKVSFGKRKTR